MLYCSRNALYSRQYLTTADFGIREELALKAAILAEKFAPDLSWYYSAFIRKSSFNALCGCVLACSNSLISGIYCVALSDSQTSNFHRLETHFAVSSRILIK